MTQQHHHGMAAQPLLWRLGLLALTDAAGAALVAPVSLEDRGHPTLLARRAVVQIARAAGDALGYGR